MAAFALACPCQRLKPTFSRKTRKCLSPFPRNSSDELLKQRGLLGRPMCSTKCRMKFEIVGAIQQIETIAAGPGVKLQAYLRKVHGKGRWRKVKGVATVRLRNGDSRRVELHWYEAHGVGRRDFKIKKYLDQYV